jgi:hypothetical protein
MSDRGTRVPASRRLRREARARRTRTIGIVAVAVALLAAGGWSVGRWGSPSTTAGASSGAARSSPAVFPTQPVPTLLLAVRGAGAPLVAVVGGGPSPTILPIPTTLAMTLPGRGDGDTTVLASMPGDEMRTAASNLVGMWISHYAVTDVDHLVALVDRGGGLRVSLTGIATLGSDVIGPGRVTLTGAQVKAYLAVRGPNELTRWEVVMTAILANPPGVARGDLLETDNATAVSSLLTSAKGAQVRVVPTKVVTDTILLPMYPQLDESMARYFGVEAPPVPVILENGSGVPGIGETVARKIVPAGFRVTISDNAQSFHHPVTQVIAVGKDHVPEAHRAQRALGLGKVGVTPVPSGLGDITIVIGKDLKR